MPDISAPTGAPAGPSGTGDSDRVIPASQESIHSGNVRGRTEMRPLYGVAGPAPEPSCCGRYVDPDVDWPASGSPAVLVHVPAVLLEVPPVLAHVAPGLMDVLRVAGGVSGRSRGRLGVGQRG